ncbi:MAG: hypothetical protein HY866_02170 [Chloroflexi bacterium]|nr:hypothetical protein [Chloroflexota bacterium]
MSTQPKRAPWLWPLLLMIGGGVLLLDNFMLIEIDPTPYWPVVLVVLGLQLLWRGDIGPSWQAHSFGITRGSVQSASLEIESGELDVQLRALHKSGRLIAGQYTARSRPGLTVRNNHATLRMQRGQTWWLSLADWDVGLAQDLPWNILISSTLGRLDTDLRGLRVERAYVSSGLGSVAVICPEQVPGTLLARSTFGDVRITIPQDSRALIHVRPTVFGRTSIHSSHVKLLEPGVYATFSGGEASASGEPADLHIIASTVFGTIYIQ